MNHQEQEAEKKNFGCLTKRNEERNGEDGQRKGGGDDEETSDIII